MSTRVQCYGKIPEVCEYWLNGMQYDYDAIADQITCHNRIDFTRNTSLFSRTTQAYNCSIDMHYKLNMIAT